MSQRPIHNLLRRQFVVRPEDQVGDCGVRHVALDEMEPGSLLLFCPFRILHLAHQRDELLPCEPLCVTSCSSTRRARTRVSRGSIMSEEENHGVIVFNCASQRSASSTDLSPFWRRAMSVTLFCAPSSAMASAPFHPRS